MEINISIHQAKDPVAVMGLKGSLDASNFMEVVASAQQIYKNPAKYLIIDLSEVPYISSAGLVAIHKIALLYSGTAQVVDGTGPQSRLDFTHSSMARKHVKLLSPQPAVEETLETAGLKLFFKIFTDLESAINSL